MNQHTQKLKILHNTLQNTLSSTLHSSENGAL